jgi:hypothetical protein
MRLATGSRLAEPCSGKDAAKKKNHSPLIYFISSARRMTVQVRMTEGGRSLRSRQPQVGWEGAEIPPPFPYTELLIYRP